MSAQRAVARGTAAVHPGSLTGRQYAKDLAAKKAREAAEAAAVDPEALRRQITAEIVDKVYDRAWAAGYAAAVEDFQNAGIDVDELLNTDNTVATDDTEAEA